MYTDCESLCARDPALFITDFGKYGARTPIGSQSFREAADYFQHLQFQHPDHTKLAARLLLEEIYTACGDVSFSEYFTGHRLIDSDSYGDLDIGRVGEFIRPDRDMHLSFVAVQILRRSYLLRDDDGTVTEPPQYFFMRCAICVTGGRDVERIRATYDAMSRFEYIHSSATLFNACKANRQYSSCFVMSVDENNVFDKLPRIKNILLSGGGIGVNINGCSPAGKYRGADTRVSTVQKGICDSVLNVLNATVTSVNPYNRRGSIAVYLDVWHPDVLDFITAKMPHGANTFTELFYGINVNNRFMDCVVNDRPYHLIDPNTCPTMAIAYSSDVYDKCVAAGLTVREISAREIMTYIIKAQSQSGVPYVINIEAVNAASNHRNVGAVPCGNLCTEIFQYHDEGETAVCNLASINVSRFVSPSQHPGPHEFRHVGGCECVDFAGVEIATRLAVANLNTLIDTGLYPDETCRRSNMKHRPIGVGIQGLFDALQKLNLSVDGDAARDFNSAISEHVYYYCLDESAAIAERHGRGAYGSFGQSDFSRGILQFNYYPRPPHKHFIDQSKWNALRLRIIKNGIGNSLLTACMPTATVSGIFGTSEGVEPYITNIYTRSLLSGDITVINRNLVDVLKKYDLYNTATIDSIIKADGSVRGVDLPEHVKKVFPTAYEIDGARLRTLAADRAKFIDQGQSINMYIDCKNPSAAKNMIRAYVDMYEHQMKNYVYYVYGKASSKPMDPILSRSCKDGQCCQ